MLRFSLTPNFETRHRFWGQCVSDSLLIWERLEVIIGSLNLTDLKTDWILELLNEFVVVMGSYSTTYGNPYAVLDLCLKNILSLIKPMDNDGQNRRNTINALEAQIHSMESLRGADVRPFGSFVSNLFTRWGDLDISVELSRSAPSSISKMHKQYALREIMKVLRRSGIGRNIHFIPNARVPLLIYHDHQQNISCDVSIDNHLGHIKSRILLWITEIDERFRDMVLLTKEWAKAQNINDPKSGTLNSYSLCLLVIFHLQTCTPPILPPFRNIYPGNIGDATGTWFSIERQLENVCFANIAQFKSSRQRNQSSLSQLLVSFYDKFSRMESFASDYAICTYTGRWERISSKPQWMVKSHSLLIEDPFEQPDNAARAVGLRELSVISNAFRDASQKLSSHLSLMDRNSLLAILARPSIRSQLGLGTQGYYTTDGGRGNHPQVGFSGYVAHSHER